MSQESKCPFHAGQGVQATGRARSNRDWWPNQLNLKILHQHSPASNPLGADFGSYKNHYFTIRVLFDDAL